MTEDELRNMITESFNVFQDYMKIKMQATGAGSEEMIEESIRAFKCYMLNQINEWIFFIMYLFYLPFPSDLIVKCKHGEMQLRIQNILKIWGLEYSKAF